ncbi:hypothetical protein AGMMS49992_21830 [Clostridia bacterium]|nr:hypothetical protein AGMMS49992_21830 [Clostridia bacterium]
MVRIFIMAIISVMLKPSNTFSPALCFIFMLIASYHKLEPVRRLRRFVVSRKTKFITELNSPMALE